MESKPIITRTTHVLPFDRLSWQDFERMCLALLLREDFTNLEHLGATGSENGRDIVGTRGDELWYVQCKRVSQVGAQDLLQELEKMVGPDKRSKKKRPDGVLFMVSCNVSPIARDRTVERCQELKVACQIWAQTDLDARVQEHPDVVREFFGLFTQSEPDTPPCSIEGNDLSHCVEDLSDEDEQALLPFAFMTPEHLERELEETQHKLHDNYLRRVQAKLSPDASVDAEAEERRAVELRAQLTELGKSWSIVQKAQVPSRMLIKDFLEGNVYGAVLMIFIEPLRGDFDDLNVVQAIGKESPAYRRRMAQNFLGDPDASDIALSEVIQRTIRALVNRPNSPYVLVADNRYRRIYI